MESIDERLIEARLREDRRNYAINKLYTWTARIGGLAMIAGGAIAEIEGYDGKIWMIGGASVSLTAYFLHPYRLIQNRLTEEIDFLQRKMLVKQHKI